MTPLPLTLRGPIKVCANTLEILTFSFLVSVFFAQGVGVGCRLWSVNWSVSQSSWSVNRRVGQSDGLAK